METKDMKQNQNQNPNYVFAEKDGEKVKMSLAHFKAVQKKGWKQVSE